MWLSGWQYRKKITIQGSSGAGINYQVFLKVGESSGSTGANFHLEGHSAKFPSGRNDGGDLAFTLSDGITLLSFWVEDVVGTAPNRIAYIWVKVADNLDTNKDIYVYYGNPNSTNASNENAVFDYVDRGDQISSWTLVGSCGQSTSDGNPTPSYYAVSTVGSYMYRNINLVPGRVIIFNIKTNGLGNLFFLVDSTGAGQMYRSETRSPYYSGFARTMSWTSWDAPSSGFLSTANVWYKFTIVITSPTSATLYYAETTDASPRTETFGTLVGTYTITNNGGYIGLVGDGLGSIYKTWWDNIIVRKYVSPEPSFYSAGIEETLNIAIIRRRLLVR